MIAAIGSKGTRGKIWTMGYFVAPVFLLIFAEVRWVPASLLVMVIAGWGLMAMINTTNALIQSYVPDHLRGRVMGVYALVFMGGSPVGSLIAGWLADAVGEPLTVTLFSSIFLLSAIVTYFNRPKLRLLN
jgi:MFS family permease